MLDNLALLIGVPAQISAYFAIVFCLPIATIALCVIAARIKR